MITAIKILIFFTFVTGFVYPIFVTGISQVLFSTKANGSLLQHDKKIIGSELIGQNFSSDKYFKSRPSVIEYNPSGSGATNLSITSKKFKSSVEERRKSFKSHDLLTSSGSGLDPHITQRAALEQVEIISMARALDSFQRKKVIDLINSSIETKTLGFMGNERVNVLKLNLKIDEIL